MMLLLWGLAAQSQTQNYTASTEIFANPERGFYHYRSSGASGYSALSQTELTNFRKNEKVTLIWREFRLDAYKTGVIAQTYLTKMQADFTALRAAGVKAIVRFNYTNTDGTDASKAQILAHIEQLKPILAANEDVISSVEAGFIGNYGEWYDSDNFGKDNLTTQNKADRLAVGTKIMELAPHRMVAFRTPVIQRQVAGTGTVTTATAYNGSILSRVAAHNDCFLSSSDDYGTYINATTDYTYLENQSKYTFDGGETCSLTSYSACANAVSTMNRFHFNYLNSDYNQDVTMNWQSNGCLDEVKRRLGYRFELQNSSIASNVLTINLQNVGFGNVINDRKAYVVCKNTTTGTEIPLAIATNVRLWQAGVQTRLTQSLTSLPNGTYQLYLNIPDLQLGTNPVYSIKCANTGLWDEIKGYNNLNQTVTITGGVAGTPTTPPDTTPTTPPDTT
ncbi:MAG TPA: DUF4832 domain-containing protein, partial [Flavobacterium sp.]|nr:DUF4832 domain-containing protein [Flavobacterium sp.]